MITSSLGSIPQRDAILPGEAKVVPVLLLSLAASVASAEPSVPECMVLRLGLQEHGSVEADQVPELKACIASLPRSELELRQSLGYFLVDGVRWTGGPQGAAERFEAVIGFLEEQGLPGVAAHWRFWGTDMEGDPESARQAMAFLEEHDTPALRLDVAEWWNDRGDAQAGATALALLEPLPVDYTPRWVDWERARALGLLGRSDEAIALYRGCCEADVEELTTLLTAGASVLYGDAVWPEKYLGQCECALGLLLLQQEQWQEAFSMLGRQDCGVGPVDQLIAEERWFELLVAMGTDGWMFEEHRLQALVELGRFDLADRLIQARLYSASGDERTWWLEHEHALMLVAAKRGGLSQAPEPPVSAHITRESPPWYTSEPLAPQDWSCPEPSIPPREARLRGSEERSAGNRSVRLVRIEPEQRERWYQHADWQVWLRDGAEAAWDGPYDLPLTQTDAAPIAGSSIPLFDGDTLLIEVERYAGDQIPAVEAGCDADGWRNPRSLLRIDLERLRADSDGDGLTDLHEIRILTDPTRADSDGDGLDDGEDPLPLASRAGEPSSEGEVVLALVEQLLQPYVPPSAPAKYGHEPGPEILTWPLPEVPSVSPPDPLHPRSPDHAISWPSWLDCPIASQPAPPHTGAPLLIVVDGVSLEGLDSRHRVVVIPRSVSRRHPDPWFATQVVKLRLVVIAPDGQRAFVERDNPGRLDPERFYLVKGPEGWKLAGRWNCPELAY